MKRGNLKGITFFLAFFGILYGFFSVRVDKYVSQKDIEAIKLLDLGDSCKKLNSFEDEIKCIKKVQASQLLLVKGKECRGNYIEAGSIEFIKSNTGCCFDRSRFIEQTLQYYGFKVRHIHLNHSEGKGYLNTLIPGTQSHATSEVLTSKGWLGVDSNEEFILLKDNIKPITYAEAIKSGLADQLSETGFYKSPTIYIVGLYSRNGTFFKPYLPYFPEINYMDFLLNIKSLSISNPPLRNI